MTNQSRELMVAMSAVNDGAVNVSEGVLVAPIVPACADSIRLSTGRDAERVNTAWNCTKSC